MAIGIESREASRTGCGAVWSDSPSAFVVIAVIFSAWGQPDWKGELHYRACPHSDDPVPLRPWRMRRGLQVVVSSGPGRCLHLTFGCDVHTSSGHDSNYPGLGVAATSPTCSTFRKPS